MLHQILKRDGNVFFAVHGSSKGCEQVGVSRSDDLIPGQIQGADKGRAQFRKEMKGPSKERHIAPDRLSAGETADGLVDHGLKNGSRQVLSGSPVIDQGLDVGFGEHAAPGGNGIYHLIIFSVFVKAGGIRLQQRRHLVDK